MRIGLPLRPVARASGDAAHPYRRLAGAKSAELPLTTRNIYRALAANPFGDPQAALAWSDVDGALPHAPIEIYGPPGTSGTRDALRELVLQKGCMGEDRMVQTEPSPVPNGSRSCAPPCAPTRPMSSKANTTT